MIIAFSPRNSKAAHFSRSYDALVTSSAGSSAAGGGTAGTAAGTAAGSAAATAAGSAAAATLGVSAGAMLLGTAWGKASLETLPGLGNLMFNDNNK